VFPRSRLSVEAGVQDRAFVRSTFTTRQRRLATESLTIAVDSRDHATATARASLRFGDWRVGGTFTAGRRMSVGGVASSIEPDALLVGRILDAALRRGAAFAERYRGVRLEVSSGDLTFFWQRHHAGSMWSGGLQPADCCAHIDVIGVETTLATDPLPLLKALSLDLTAGIARVRPENKTRAWLALRWRP
jgi:hypothetical protein